MLTPADAELARRDEGLPGLATVLDPEAVVERAAAGADGLRAHRAEATYVRYKPGTSCVVGYRLATDAGPVLAYAKAHHPSDAAKLDKARQKEAPDETVGWGVIAVPSQTVLVATASSDRDLPALAVLADTDRRRSLLMRLLPDDPDLWAAEPRPIRHKPERRWVGLVEREGEPVAVVKAYRSADVATARAGQAALAGPARRGLGWCRRRATVASAWVPGVALSDSLATASRVDVMAVGAALARLHSLTPTSELPHVATQATMGAVAEAAESTASLVPHLGASARLAADRVCRAFALLPPLERVVHGDFSADQVIVSGDGVAIIDFDRAAIGDPAADLGSFAAEIDRAELEGRLSPTTASRAVAELVAGHGDADGPPVGNRLAVHRAAALLRLAVAPFRERHPDWPTATAAILGRVDALTAGWA